VRPAGVHAPATERPQSAPNPAPLPETIDERLLAGFTPQQQQDLRDAVAGAARLANNAPEYAAAIRRTGRS
jgi:hypothetical protein